LRSADSSRVTAASMSISSERIGQLRATGFQELRAASIADAARGEQAADDLGTSSRCANAQADGLSPPRQTQRRPRPRSLDAEVGQPECYGASHQVFLREIVAPPR
jgi:hypothetical protein